MADTYTLTIPLNDPLSNLSAYAAPVASGRDRVAKPKAGEQTGDQRARASGGTGFSSVRVAGFDPPQESSYKLYDEMDRDDTVALVRSVVEGPIIAAGQKYSKASDDVPDAWVDAVRRTLDPAWHELVRDCLASGFSYGNAPFELVWSDDRTTIVRFKPLRPTLTDYLADGKGVVRGIVNRKSAGDDDGAVQLVGAKAFWWTYKGSFGDPYGTSRHEPIKTPYAQKVQLLDRLGALVRKYSGNTAQLHYPEGVTKDVDGVEYPNVWLGRRVLDAVARGEPVLFPNKYAGMVGDNPRGEGLKLAGLSDWTLSKVELGTTADYTKGVLDATEACDRRIVQGWLRPARSVLEAEHGSRADAEQHTATGSVEAQLVANDLCRAITRGIADLILVVNFGERARGAVVVESNPIDDDRPRMLLNLITAAVSSQTLAPDVWQRLDRDAMLDQVDLPLLIGKIKSGKAGGGVPPGGELLTAPTPPGASPGPSRPPRLPDDGEQTLSRLMSGHAKRRAAWLDVR